MGVGTGGIALFVCGGVGVLVVVVALALVGMYNRLVTLRSRVQNAWAQIDVQLKQRYDLVPNLVETVKGYAAHESSTFEAVVAARNAAMSATTVEEQGQAENVLTGALRQLFALAEAYPDLKANQNFMDLQTQLTTLESKIAYARQFYNDSVMTYDQTIKSFPMNLVAGMFGFTERPYFEIEAGQAETPQVKF